MFSIWKRAGSFRFCCDMLSEPVAASAGPIGLQTGRTFYGQCSTCSDMLFHLTRPITMCRVHCCLIKNKRKKPQNIDGSCIVLYCFVAQWSTTVLKIRSFVSLIASIQIKSNCLWLNFVFIKTNFSPESRRCGVGKIKKNIQTCRGVYSRPQTKKKNNSGLIQCLQMPRQVITLYTPMYFFFFSLSFHFYPFSFQTACSRGSAALQLLFFLCFSHSSLQTSNCKNNNVRKVKKRCHTGVVFCDEVAW